MLWFQEKNDFNTMMQPNNMAFGMKTITYDLMARVDKEETVS